MIKYSREWAEGVVTALMGNYPRASNFLGQGVLKSYRKVTLLLMEGEPEWAIFRELVRVLDNWIAKTTIEQRTTTQMLSYLARASKLICRNRLYRPISLLTAFGFDPKIIEQSFQGVEGSPSHRVGESVMMSLPVMKEKDSIFHGEEVQCDFDFG